MSYAKRIVRADPFPFRVGAVRLASPGWLNGQYTEHDPREEYEVAVWEDTGYEEGKGAQYDDSPWACGDCGTWYSDTVDYCTRRLDDYLSLRGGSIRSAIAQAVAPRMEKILAVYDLPKKEFRCTFGVLAA